MWILKLLLIIGCVIGVLNLSHYNFGAIGNDPEWDDAKSEKRHYIIAPVCMVLWFAIELIKHYVQ